MALVNRSIASKNMPHMPSVPYDSPAGRDLCKDVLKKHLPYEPHDYQLDGVCPVLDGLDLLANTYWIRKDRLLPVLGESSEGLAVEVQRGDAAGPGGAQGAAKLLKGTRGMSIPGDEKSGSVSFWCCGVAQVLLL